MTTHMTPGELARLFELMGYQGVAQTYIDRLIASVGRARAEAVDLRSQDNEESPCQ